MLSTNHKLSLENSSLGYVGVGLSLIPHKLSGYNVCSSSSPECRKHCINLSGNGFYPSVQKSRLDKTKLFHEDRPAFLRALHKSITKHLNKLNHPAKLAIRLNVFSDIMWEKVDKSLFDYPAQFYDYTKHVKRYQRFLDGSLPDNYHLCFSRSELNDDASERFLEAGGQVNYVFKVKPPTYKGFPVYDGDTHDFRFLDPPGVIAVRPKGLLRGKNSLFVLGQC